MTTAVYPIQLLIMDTPNESKKVKIGLPRTANAAAPQMVRGVLRIVLCFILILAALISCGCALSIDGVSPAPTEVVGDASPTDEEYTYSTTLPPNWSLWSSEGKDKPPSPTAQVFELDDYEMHNLLFPWNMDGKTSSNAPVYEVKPFVLSFLLPKGFRCLSHPVEPELYLDARYGADTGVGIVYSIYWIYDERDVCVGAVGYDLYRAFTSHEDDPSAIYSMINENEYYRFATDEYYYPIHNGAKNVTALTQLYISADWLRSFGVKKASDRLHVGILSYDKDCGVYVAFDFFHESLKSVELMDVAESIRISPAG